MTKRELLLAGLKLQELGLRLQAEAHQMRENERFDLFSPFAEEIHDDLRGLERKFDYHHTDEDE